jgi:dCTP diphosphatase
MSFKNIKDVEIALAEFAKDRDWDKYHQPKNLVMALTGEIGELNEIFQWLTEEQASKIMETKGDHVREELADVFLYLVRLASKLDVDLLEASASKIKVNAVKYPRQKLSGTFKKYNE